jgi:hypothetical protein
MLDGVDFSCQQIGVNIFYKCIEFQVNSFDSYWEIKKISLISMYYVETRADNSGYINHRVIAASHWQTLSHNGVLDTPRWWPPMVLYPILS